MTTIQIVTFNVLAPCWANPSSYPEGSRLDRVYRRGKIISVLQSLAPKTDFFCLQETTPTEYVQFAEALTDFTGVQVNHDSSYWSRYATENPPWESNGVALFIKKKVYSKPRFNTMINSDDGNHGAYAEMTHVKTGKKIGLVSIHLDSDTGGHRDKEFSAVLDFLKSRSVDITLIGADLNYVTTSGPIKKGLEETGLVDLLGSLGIEKRTCPDIAGYTNSTVYSTIDHLLVKGATPVTGDVIDNNLWNLYPDESDARLELNLQLSGSDHFPVWGQVRF